MARMIRSMLLILGALALLAVSTPLPLAQAAQEPTTPEDMYEVAVKQLDKGYYTRAVELLERIRLRYPLSQYAVLSELRIGDSHFKKGEYPEAVDAYQGFIKAHPRHAQLDYVIYQIALSEFKQAPGIAGRDQTPTWRMLKAIDGNQSEGVLPFEERFPSSQYLEKVKKMRTEARERLARGVFDVGRYYYRRGRFMVDKEGKAIACRAATERFEQVLDLYPDVPALGAKALYHEGLCQAQQGQKKEATTTLERLKTRFPDSKYIGRLHKRIARIKKEVPPLEIKPPPEPGAEPLPTGAEPLELPATEPEALEPPAPEAEPVEPPAAEPEAVEPPAAEPASSEPRPAEDGAAPADSAAPSP